ncbi:hypothetical protein RchiOBHm_Chr3g0458951 [Rosa chinensis]|uniref:Uncharacterized protein n=1 Tax=Rosa chinensis TaxID=74649 RepID=A0A2P6R7Y5_ROSCH|nr:hypothetical protein RchiOBHm_Chr3g0458951 [Rosa chinensis]
MFNSLTIFSHSSPHTLSSSLLHLLIPIFWDWTLKASRELSSRVPHLNLGSWVKKLLDSY